MTDKTEQRFETLAIHAGTPPDEATGARVIPIHQSASFVFNSPEHASNLFHLKEVGYIYSRLTNPTVGALEARLAALEGGVGATCTSSGHAAQMLALSTIMGPGDHIVASDHLYGGTHNQFANTFPQTFGWQCSFAENGSPDSFKKAIQDNTKAIFIESLANPGGVVSDIEAIAKIAENAGVPLIVDNTMATPYLCRPFEYGASIICHSTTKFLSGHGYAMGGAVVDGGTFEWTKYADKFPALTQEQPGYRGNNFCENFGNMAFAIHNHAIGLRDLGMNQQPMNAWLTLAGIETLPLRMERQCDNAQKVAEFLESRPEVAWVRYAGLDSSPYRTLAQKYLRGGKGGAVFTFGLKGGYEAGIRLVESLELFSHLANIGDARSLVIHPASTTHSQLSPEARAAAGAGDDVVRLSVGLENIEDLLADLTQGLEKCQTAGKQAKSA